MLPLVLTSCLITEVVQPEYVGTQEEFNVSITVVDSLSDPNAWRGTVSVMVPEAWEFASGKYDGDIGAGDMLLRENWHDVVDSIPISKTDSMRTPDIGMKWLDLVSDSAYGYVGPVTNVISINLTTSADTGKFNLGYIVSKDAFPFARDVLGFWQDGSADSLFNQTVEVRNTTNTNVEERYPENFKVELYPNPSSGLLHLDIESKSSEYMQIDIFDLMGRSVRNDIVSRATSRSSMELDLTRLAPGRYLLRMTDSLSSQHRHQMVIVQ